MDNYLRFRSAVDRLYTEAKANRKYEGFLGDISTRPELEEFMSSGDYHTKYRFAKIQIEAVEVTLLMYLQRVWDNGNSEYLSLRSIRGILDEASPILMLGEAHDTNDVAADALNRPPKYLPWKGFIKRIWEWNKAYDESVAKHGSLLERLRILRDTQLAHSLEKSRSKAGNNRENFDEFGQLKEVYMSEVLELAKDTGDLIDELTGLISKKVSTNPRKFSKVFGDQYWNDLVRLPRRR